MKKVSEALDGLVDPIALEAAERIDKMVDYKFMVKELAYLGVLKHSIEIDRMPKESYAPYAKKDILSIIDTTIDSTLSMMHLMSEEKAKKLTERVGKSLGGIMKIAELKADTK